jgi:SAM-dependent methyltransferase
MAELIHKLKNRLQPPLPLFKLLNRGKEQFQCPICNYEGPFRDMSSFAGVRKHAKCPQCGALERHRLQYLVLMDLFERMDCSKMRMLHFAPESFFKSMFQNRFGKYETADLVMKDVDYNVDIQNLPFEDNIYDFVFASHVLEHIPNDGKALQEIRRILKPNGVAILPVPVVCEKTIEYPEANPSEAYHMRAPGLDYFERYGAHFGKVDVRTSNLLPEKHQPFIYEDRSVWPTEACPLRPPMSGKKHADFVPVCYA